MSTSQIKALEDFVRLMDRNATAHAIRTAVDLGVLTELDGGQKTIEQLARSLSLNSEALQLLMNVLCHTELIEKYGDDYALSAVARLIPQRFRDLGDHHWQYLGEYIRSGKSLPVDDELPVTEADFVINWASTQWTQTPAAMDVAEVLEIGDRLTDLNILEVGGGAAVFGAAIAHRDPGANLTMLDSAAGLKRAETTVHGIGLDDRAVCIEGDYRTDQWLEEVADQKFDLVIAAGITHRHPPQDNLSLFQRLGRAIAATGQLAVIDVFAGQQKGDVHRRIFELELRLRTAQGRVYQPLEIEQLLLKAGFGQVKFAHLPSPPYIWGLIVARTS